jgi:uncharacterized protein involved in tolerance to divalent cations
VIENMDRKFSIIYVTVGDMNEARKIGRKLVEEGLCNRHKISRFK